MNAFVGVGYAKWLFAPLAWSNSPDCCHWFIILLLVVCLPLLSVFSLVNANGTKPPKVCHCLELIFALLTRSCQH